MKKILLLLSIFASYNLSTAQDCTEIFFSEYMAGYNNNKYLEIFNPTSNGIDLSAYRIVRWSNGNNAADNDYKYVQPLSGTINSMETFTCFLDRRVVGATGVDTILWSDLLALANTIVSNNKGGFYSPDYDADVQGAKCLSFNGDDAFSIQKNIGGTWTNIDIFAKIGELPTGGSWTDTPPYNNGVGNYMTLDITLRRKPTVRTGVKVNPASFNTLAEWDSSFVHDYSNLGSHSCNCFVGIDNLKNSDAFSAFPNPSMAGTSIFIHQQEQHKSIRMFDLSSREVKAEISNDGTQWVIRGLKAGNYLIMVENENGGFSRNMVTVLP